MVLEDPSVRLMNYVIDRVIPFWKMAEAAGIEDFPRGESTCYCPFHENYDTKAAKVFRDATGDRIWCFAEHKMYYPHDIVRLKMVKQPLEVLFKRIWGQLTDEQQSQLLAEFDQPVDTMPANWDEVKERLELYRSGNLSYQQVVEELLNLSK